MSTPPTDTQRTHFSVAPDAGFYVIVGDSLSVYEGYEQAIAEIQTQLSTDEDSFLAEVTIDAADDEDVAVALEQVSWQQVIRDLTTAQADHLEG